MPALGGTHIVQYEKSFGRAGRVSVSFRFVFWDSLMLARIASSSLPDAQAPRQCVPRAVFAIAFIIER